MGVNFSEEVVEVKVDLYQDRVRLILGRVSTFLPADQALLIGQWVVACARELAEQHRLRGDRNV